MNTTRKPEAIDHDDNDHHDEHKINNGESHDSSDLAKNGVDDDQDNVYHHETLPSKKINIQLMILLQYHMCDLYKDSTTLEMYYLMCSSDQLLAHVLGRPASWRLVFLWQ